jgi:uncharacterized protein YqhQ
MNDEQIKKIIDSPEEYDELKEESYISWIRFAFKNCQRWTIILVFAHFFFFLALAIVCGILFLITDTTKYQIMYAAFFVCCILIGYLIKVFGWVMVTKNSLKREIKRLELRIAELSETMKNK